MPSVTNTVTIGNTSFSERLESQTRTIYTDLTSATSEPFEIEVQQNTSGKRGSARNSVIVVRKDIPYTTATGATQVERISAAITIRHQPDVLYTGKDTKLQQVLSTAILLASNGDVVTALLAGVHNLHNVTVSNSNS